jgi:hypothetical protein
MPCDLACLYRCAATAVDGLACFVALVLVWRVVSEALSARKEKNNALQHCFEKL